MQIATLTNEQMPASKLLDRATVEQWAAEAREDLPNQLGTDFDELEVMLAVARRASSAAAHVQKSLIAELEADNESLRRINDAQDKALATLEAQVAEARGMDAQAWADFEALRHSANEWADMATSGLQWLRNIVDGISDSKQALANLESNLKHCRAVNDDPAAQRAIKAIAAAVAAKTVKQAEMP